MLGADGLLYQSIEDLVHVGQEMNPSIKSFDTSCFTGVPLCLVLLSTLTAWKACGYSYCVPLSEGCECCAGQYVTESISEEYLQQLEASHRLVERKRPGVKSLSMTGTL